MLVLIRHVRLGLMGEGPGGWMAVRSVSPLHRHVQVLRPQSGEVFRSGVQVDGAVWVDEAHVRSWRLIVGLADEGVP